MPACVLCVYTINVMLELRIFPNRWKFLCPQSARPSPVQCLELGKCPNTYGQWLCNTDCPSRFHKATATPSTISPRANGKQIHVNLVLRQYSPGHGDSLSSNSGIPRSVALVSVVMPSLDFNLALMMRS